MIDARLLMPLTMLACAFLNCFRGGHFGAQHLPGHPRFYVAPLIGLVAWAFQPPPVASAQAAAYLVFVWPGWGRWYSGNRIARELSGPPSRFERWIEAVSDIGGVRRDRVAFFLRNTLCLVPGLGLIAYVAGVPVILALFGIVPAALVVWLYDIGFLLSAKHGVAIGESLTGAMIGAGIAFSERLL